ncbi:MULTISPECIES: cache domain-containing sensor histidine kinase [Paenibacillus]|uniref:Sensor histidine kinase n=1 Tax=Paenibacillus odorifer TaxID=189426 RepID=A0A1R0XBS0_9BACL|nr:histidine kinase [Paenibacillus odorifer]OMC73210.1 sensor histidine kinase [Paenibacillus odorifer]OMD32509.1 sensor histidine kinase [Paenibacillus odorifer]OMD73538.1 sensor histidine kinase [Paenibacillus odorifer]OMD90497.1 sensor histidine kinase [Paenibacillus odorifer]
MLSRLIRPILKLNVKQQLILLFLIMISPILFLNIYGNMKAEQILKRHVTNAYVELNKQNFTIINRDIDTVNKITTTVIQNPLIQQINMTGSDTILERVKRYETIEKLLVSYSQGAERGDGIYYSLYIYDPEDYYFFAPNFPQVKKAGVYFFSKAEEPYWFEEVVQKKGRGSLKFTGKLSAQAENLKTLTYMRAVNNISRKAETIGVLVITKMDAKIGESLKSISLPDGDIYLTDLDNRVLASTTNNTGEIITLPETVVAEDLEGTVDVITSDFIYVVNNNHALGQKLVYKIAVKALLQQQNEMKSVIQYITVAYAVFGLIMITYFWRSLMTPLQKLAFFVRKFEPGNRVPETPKRGSNDEVSVLIGSTYDMARRLNGLITYKYQMELKQKESQLQLLYQQINPHLLYNTLESIYWKSSLEGNVESAEMIKELSKLMKISLSRGRELISLEEELEHATAYIKLQQHRYDYIFRVVMKIHPDTKRNLIPKITLQPLIENAIIHGVKNMGEDGEIIISAVCVDDTVEITIEDNGYKSVDYQAIEAVLNDDSPNPASGYGIRNINQRIHLHFGSDYGISYTPRKEGGTLVTVKLPKSENQD